MPEGGLSPSEVGKEISEHAKHAAEHAGSEASERSELLSILEAVLLSVVAILAAYSGYSSAKWSTKSSVSLAGASAARTKASNADLDALSKRNFDASTFNAWFSAYVANNQRGMRLAKRRFTPIFRTAFNAWWATDPTTNAHSPPGPTYMPQYKLPDVAAAAAYQRIADANFTEGEDAGGTSDKYVRITVFLASVLFLVGISGHFRLRAARIGLIVTGSVILVISVVQLLQLPRPPA